MNRAVARRPRPAVARRPRPAVAASALFAAIALFGLAACPGGDQRAESPQPSAAPAPLTTGSCGGDEQPPCHQDCTKFFPPDELGDAGKRCGAE